MKARVKETGEIVDGSAMVSFQGDDFYLDELEIIQDEPDKTLYDELDDVYWANMKHQYAGMAMQGMLNNSYLAGEFRKDPNNGIAEMSNTITKAAVVYATALVEKLKGDSNA